MGVESLTDDELFAAFVRRTMVVREHRLADRHADCEQACGYMFVLLNELMRRDRSVHWYAPAR